MILGGHEAQVCALWGQIPGWQELGNILWLLFTALGSKVSDATLGPHSVNTRLPIGKTLALRGYLGRERLLGLLLAQSRLLR